MGPKYCKDKSNYDNVDAALELCAGVPDGDGNGLTDGGKGFCPGDEGGPLICVENQKAVIQGVASWSEKCGKEGYPGVYVKVSALSDWINQAING